VFVKGSESVRPSGTAERVPAGLRGVASRPRDVKHLALILFVLLATACQQAHNPARTAGTGQLNTKGVTGTTPSSTSPSETEGGGQAGNDVGLRRDLCYAVHFSGDVDGDGTLDRVWLGGQAFPSGACPAEQSRRRILVIDLHRDGLPDVTSTAMDCSTWCVLFALADLNADGVAEILVNEGHLAPPVSAIIGVYQLRNAHLEPVELPDGGNRFGLANSWTGYSGAFCGAAGNFVLWSGTTDGGGTLRKVGWYTYGLDPTALRFELDGVHGPTATHELPASTGYDGHLCGAPTLPLG